MFLPQHTASYYIHTYYILLVINNNNKGRRKFGEEIDRTLTLVVMMVLQVYIYSQTY